MSSTIVGGATLTDQFAARDSTLSVLKAINIWGAIHFALKLSNDVSENRLNLLELMNNFTSLSKVTSKFISEIERLKELTIRKDAEFFQLPTNLEVNRFKVLATALLDKDISNALLIAEELDYEVTLFEDRETQQQYFRLLEKTIDSNDSQERFIRGWGSYFFNVDNTRQGLVEVPHTIADTDTEYVGAKAFIDSKSRIFLLAGAHRDAGGAEKGNYADVCDPERKVFQGIHEAGVDAKLDTWQIHGFNLKKKKNLPDNTVAVLSNGEGDYTPAIKNLEQQLKQQQFASYICSDCDSVVNGSFEECKIARLSATQNIQGQYSNRNQGSFVHIELINKVRTNESRSNEVAEAISEAILSSYSE